MKVAIVGCGYIGAALGTALLGSGTALEVRATTTRASRLLELTDLGFRSFLCALPANNEDSTLAEIVTGTDLVYFTAAAGGRHNVDRYRQVFVEGGRQVVAACAGAGVARLIYTSSCSVYGQTDGGWVDEESPTLPGTDHGLTLLEAESSLLEGSEASGVEATVLRLSGIYGPDRGPQRFADRLSGQEREGGEAYLNLIHRDDVVEALIRLAGVRHPGVLNWTDDHPVTRREYYDRILAAAELPGVVWIEGPDRGKRVSNALAKRVLGIELRHPRH